MFKKICCFLFVLLIAPQIAYAEDIDISAESAIVLDAFSNEILFEKNAYETRAVASTTKLMTCLIACETGNLSDKVTISEDMLKDCEGSLIYLEAGDEITLYDLVCGAMIASGNDAANAIAFYLAGSAEEFAKLMNLKAQELGMNSTLFVTPSGLDSNNNHSTAFDMALLASYAVLNDELISIASMKSAEITINGEALTIYNHNKLLNCSDSFIGVKTGFTEKAGRCLISAYKYYGNIIICVTLGAPDDWRDHKRLVKLSKKCYKDINQKQSIVLNVVGGQKEQVLCTLNYSVKAINNVTVKRYFYPFLYAPVSSGDVVGREEVYVNNKTIKTADITANEDIEKWQEMK